MRIRVFQGQEKKSTNILEMTKSVKFSGVPCVMLVKTFPSELRTNSAFYFAIKKDPEWLA